MDAGTKVVVTTNKDRRGVFFGTLTAHDGNGNVTLSDARNCVYWTKSTHGFLGLASLGPQDGSRVTPAVPVIEIDGVTSITQCTDQACQRWEAEPWQN